MSLTFEKIKNSLNTNIKGKTNLTKEKYSIVAFYESLCNLVDLYEKMGKTPKEALKLIKEKLKT